MSNVSIPAIPSTVHPTVKQAIAELADKLKEAQDQIAALQKGTAK